MIDLTTSRMLDKHADRLRSKGYTTEEIDAILDEEGLEEDLYDWDDEQIIPTLLD